MSEKAVTKRTETNVTTIEPSELIRLAVEQNADLDKLERLLELEQRWKADRAREAYVEAMNAFRSEAIEVIRRKGVSYNNELKYRYAPLADVLAVAVPALSQHGLSHHWETSQTEAGAITVKCIVTHAMGHSESTQLSAAPDSSGGKNSIQAIGSATAYLERYTFMAITGLAARDQDDDGNGSQALETITGEQAAEIEQKLADNKVPRGTFLRWCKVDDFGEILAKNHKPVMEQLDRIIKARK